MYRSERLTDLDELVLKCRTQQSKEYIAEALACYRAGAYRAVIVNTWIAIVYDLIDKLRELSISGDKGAKKLIDDFENHQKQIDDGNEQAIKAALEFERNILKISKEEMQFFDKQQYIDLERLREDRHRCAHPSFHRIEEPYKPSAEQARMHLRNAILHVLAQQPIQGKAAIDRVLSLVSSSYFPTGVDDAVIQLQGSELKNPKDSLVKGVVDALLFGFFEENSPLKFNSSVLSALKAVILLQRQVAEERIAHQTNKIFRDVSDNELIGAVFIALDIPEAWSALNEASKGKVDSFIKLAPSDNALPIFRHSIKKEELEEVTKSRISKLNEEELSKCINQYELSHHAIDRAIEIYTNVKSWNSANSAYEKLIKPLTKLFTKENIEEIISSPKEKSSDLLGSGGFHSFLESLEEQSSITKKEIDEMLDQHDLSRYKKEA